MRAPQTVTVRRIEPILQDLIVAVTVPFPRTTTEFCAVPVLPRPHGR
jgi:hypothetical protein